MNKKLKKFEFEGFLRKETLLRKKAVSQSITLSCMMEIVIHEKSFSIKDVLPAITGQSYKGSATTNSAFPQVRY